MTVEGHHHWLWVYRQALTPDVSTPRVGQFGGVFCIPSGQITEVDLLRRMNANFGTLLDYFEEDDVADPAALGFFAGALEIAFRGHELEYLVQGLTDYLLACAANGECVTVRID